MKLLIWLLNLHHRLWTARREIVTLSPRKASTATSAQYHYKPSDTQDKEIQP